MLFQIDVFVYCKGNSRQLKKKVEFRQHYLEPIQSLDTVTQRKLLSDVLTGQKSIAELQDEGKSLRAMKNIKETFLRYIHKHILSFS